MICHEHKLQTFLSQQSFLIGVEQLHTSPLSVLVMEGSDNVFAHPHGGICAAQEKLSALQSGCVDWRKNNRVYAELNLKYIDITCNVASIIGSCAIAASFHCFDLLPCATGSC